MVVALSLIVPALAQTTTTPTTGDCPPAELVALAPTDGAVEVPTDARFLAFFEGCGGTEWFARLYEDGAVVYQAPLIVDPGVDVLAMDLGDLAPRTAYTLEFTDERSALTTTGFTTGSDATSAVTLPPLVTASEATITDDGRMEVILDVTGRPDAAGLDLFMVYVDGVLVELARVPEPGTGPVVLTVDAFETCFTLSQQGANGVEGPACEPVCVAPPQLTGPPGGVPSFCGLASPAGAGALLLAAGAIARRRRRS